MFNLEIKDVFTQDLIKVKMTNSSKIYYEDRLFNKYHLKNGNLIICLLSFEKVWKTNFDISFNFNVKEIMLLKQ